MPEDVNWFSSVESSKLYYFYVIMGLTAMFTLLYGYIWPHCMAQDMIFMVLPRRWGGLGLLTARRHPVALCTCHCQLVSVAALLSLDSTSPARFHCCSLGVLATVACLIREGPWGCCCGWEQRGFILLFLFVEYVCKFCVMSCFRRLDSESYWGCRSSFDRLKNHGARLY